MQKLSIVPASLVGLILGLVTVGAVTALAVNGDISGTDALVAIVSVTTGGSVAVGAHVAGNVAVTAAGGNGTSSPQSSPQAPAAVPPGAPPAAVTQPAEVVPGG